MCFLCYHHAASKQESVERHWGEAKTLCPGSGQIWVSVIRPSKPTASHENNVFAFPDATVHLQNWLMEIFVRVVTASTTSSPLKDDRKGWVSLGDVDNCLNSIHGARFERDVLDAESVNIFLSHLNRWDTSANGEALNGYTIGSQLSEKWDLPGHGTRVDIDEVDSNTTPWRNSLLDLVQRLGHRFRIIVAPASQLDLVSSIHCRGHKVPW